MEPACSCIANCTFGPAEAFAQVPFDPHIDFWGDEINQSARLWTHGWNFFQADRRIMYHYWDPQQIKDRTTYRDRKNPRHQRARKRNMHLFGLEKTDDGEAIEALEHYALGLSERTLTPEYWRFVLALTWSKAKTIRGACTLPMHGGRSGAGAVGRTPGHCLRGNSGTPPPPFCGQTGDIFVNIASFRDPELSPTLRDLFAKATYPERIAVGICLQVGA